MDVRQESVASVIYLICVMMVFAPGCSENMPEPPALSEIDTTYSCTEWEFARNGLKVGFREPSGKMLVPAEYDGALFLSKDRFALDVEGCWFLYARNGHLITETCFDEIGSFYDGVAVVSRRVGEDVNYNYVNEEGRPPLAEWTLDPLARFHEGYGIVDETEQVRFIDHRGKFVASYRAAQPFSEGRAAVKLMDGPDRWTFVNEAFKPIAPAVYMEADYFSDGRAAVQIVREDGERLWGYIDREGQLAITPEYKSAGRFSEGRAAVRDRRGVGYIDHDGQMIVDPVFNIGLWILSRLCGSL